jgi:hypothetical protein
MMSFLIASFLATQAAADSCWNHNGSLMRLTDQGNNRWFYYENPRQGMRNVGVQPGTLLFNGTTNGSWYSGTARVFSSACAPLEYWVEGPVLQNPLRVRVSGDRPIHRNCQPTGQWTHDVLEFTYMYRC